MLMKPKLLICLLAAGITLVGPINMLNSAYAQDQNSSLEWSIKTDKNIFYPGEPILLTLNIKNTGTQEEKVNFGTDGIGAFLMEIRDSNGIVVAEGGKIQKYGLSRLGTLLVTPARTAHKSIVLNRWCSTLLPPGQYHIICNIEYRLRSESRKKENSEVFKAGPIHKLQLELDITIIEMNKPKFEEMLETLAGFEVKPEAQSKGEWLAKRDIAREMLAFTESKLAVPYQLQLLRNDPYTWFGPDVVNSLVKSGTLEAATGLMQIIEDPNIHTKDVKHIFVDGVYRLRETGKAEIMSATEGFVTKYKRPILEKLVD